MDRADRERLRGLLREASPGEWWWATANSLRELKAGPAYDARTVAFAYDSPSDGVPDISIAEHDMALITAARNALPELLDALDTAEARVAALEEALVGLRLHRWKNDGSEDCWCVTDGMPEGQIDDLVHEDACTAARKALATPRAAGEEETR